MVTTIRLSWPVSLVTNNEKATITVKNMKVVYYQISWQHFHFSIEVFYPFLSFIRDGLKGKNFLKVNEWEFFPISVNFVLEMTGYQLIFLRSSKLNNVKLLQIGVKMFFRDHHQYLRFMRIILYNYKGCVGCWCISWAHAKIHKTKYIQCNGLLGKL